MTEWEIANAAQQAARKAELQAYYAQRTAAGETPSPTSSNTDQLQAVDAQTGAPYGIPVSELGGGGAVALDDLTDVDLTLYGPVVDSSTMYYDEYSGKWTIAPYPNLSIYATLTQLNAATNFSYGGLKIQSSATPTPDSSKRVYIVSAQAESAVWAVPSGTPFDGQRMTLRMTDNGVAKAITYNPIYRPVGVTLPTTTVPGKVMYWEMVFNVRSLLDPAQNTWDVISVAEEE